VIFVDETVHSMPRPLSYNRSEMSHENLNAPRALVHPSTPPPSVTKPTAPRDHYPPAPAPIAAPDD